MNVTNEYYDHLDGDLLACEPGNVMEGLEFICNFGIPIVGTVLLANGIWIIHLVYNIRRRRKLVARQIRDSSFMYSMRTPGKIHLQSEASEILSFVEKLLLCDGISVNGLALMFLVYGFGTMFPTTHIRGQIGDALAAILFTVMWHVSLLQHRGAIYFKSLIPEPEVSIHHNASKSWFHLPPLSTLLDVLQSWLAPVIALVLWGLLYAGVYTRAWFMLCLFGFQGIWGLRTFVSIVVQRLATLKRVANMVGGRDGTREEQRRRRGFLRSKVITLGIDLITILFISVLTPTSVVFIGSTFSSHQFAIHIFIIYLPNVITIGLTNIHMHTKFKKSDKENENCRKKRNKYKSSAMKTNESATGLSFVSKGKSLPSGRSVVQQSDV